MIVEQQGKPLAVIITPQQWEDYLKLTLERLGETLDRIRERNRDPDPEEVERDIAQVVEEVRRERYEQRQRPH